MKVPPFHPTSQKAQAKQGGVYRIRWWDWAVFAAAMVVIF